MMIVDNTDAISIAVVVAVLFYVINVVLAVASGDVGNRDQSVNIIKLYKNLLMIYFK